MASPPTPTLADPAFLASLKSLCPPSLSTSDPESPNAVSTHLWAIVAAVALSAANTPEAVPAVFAYELAALSATQKAAGTPEEEAGAEQMVFARKIREGVLQAGLLSGMPRVCYLLSFSSFREEILDEPELGGVLGSSGGHARRTKDASPARSVLCTRVWPSEAADMQRQLVDS